MLRPLLLLSAALGCVAQSSTPAPTPLVSNPPFKFTAVRSIQGRVISDPATWDDTYKKYGLVMKQHTDTFPERYQAGMDTVNTASVEGALYYLQTEGINQADSVNCLRKSNMSYIWLLDITIVQPTFAIAEYEDNGGVVPEYGTYIAMDGGFCTPVGDQVPLECLTYNGLQYNKNLGQWIGGEKRTTQLKANYNDNVWFSFPNSCYTRRFEQKDEACRKAQHGGLCPLGVQPDGVNCTFSYDVLGYIRIDELVGITSMKSSQTGQNYRDRVEFCKDSKIEYDFSTSKSDLTFWDDPLNPDANANRTKQMIEFYNDMIKSGNYPNMKPLPDLANLTTTNPPCWKNSPRCATATNGCRRKLYSQVCEVCTSPADDCKKPGPGDSAAPHLNKQFQPALPTNAAGVTTVPRAKSGNGTLNNNGAVTAPPAGASSALSNSIALSAILPSPTITISFSQSITVGDSVILQLS
uniref:Secreted protein n=1 Tax=Thraustotheca clavata TaxID=74557 RepID=A0A0A7CLB4_9STRA|nr:secreted protein [Thraustotheca clavata]